MSIPQAKQADREMIARTVRVLAETGSVVEVRIPHTRCGTVSGYFVDFEKLADGAARWSGKAPGVYVTLNPVRPDLLARASNRLIEYAKHTTCDTDIVRRRWLPIDFDAVRPSGISATESEHKAALSRADACRRYLLESGWPEPVCADSGNGAHLLYRLDLDNDPATLSLVKRALEALSIRFSDDAVEVDVTTCNAARIWKLYGTMACKGDSTSDRPHSLARLLKSPDPVGVVSREQLEDLAAQAPVAPNLLVGGNKLRNGFDLARWISEHSLPVAEEKPWQGGRKWILNPCPWDSSHNNGAAYIVQLPDGAVAAGCHHNGCRNNDWHALRDLYEPGWRDAGPSSASQAGTADDCDAARNEEPKKPPTVSQSLVAIGQRCELFHNERDEAFARYRVGSALHIAPVRSAAFGSWLCREFHNDTGRVPGAQAKEDATRVLEGSARYDGATHAMAVRVARDGDGSLWLDLADAAWRAVHITAEGWRIVDHPPILFRRHAPSAPQVEPTRGGSLDHLRRFVNVRDDNAWRLAVAWLVAGFFPDIAHPVLVIHGEQGSAKTTLLSTLGALLDPSRTPTRSEPRDLEQWIHAADHAHLVPLDNVSRLPDWLSDAICRAVTGDGFSKRQLYTDSEDVIYAFRRVVAMTGIEVVAHRPDLLERSLLLGLSPLSPHDRRPESHMRDEFAHARPALLGALLDAVSAALRELPSVHLEKLPRMADFARVGVAVERALGWESGAFMSAYTGCMQAQNEEAIASSPVAEAILQWRPPDGRWQGPSSALLKALTEERAGTQQSARDWPRTARALSGELRRIVPNLRAAGVDVTFERKHSGRVVHIRWDGQDTVTTVTSDARSVNEGDARDGGARHVTVADEHAQSADAGLSDQRDEDDYAGAICLLPSFGTDSGADEDDPFA